MDGCDTGEDRDVDGKAIASDETQVNYYALMCEPTESDKAVETEVNVLVECA